MCAFIIQELRRLPKDVRDLKEKPLQSFTIEVNFILIHTIFIALSFVQKSGYFVPECVPRVGHVIVYSAYSLHHTPLATLFSFWFLGSCSCSMCETNGAPYVTSYPRNPVVQPRPYTCPINYCCTRDGNRCRERFEGRL